MTKGVAVAHLQLVTLRSNVDVETPGVRQDRPSPIAALWSSADPNTADASPGISKRDSGVRAIDVQRLLGRRFA